METERKGEGRQGEGTERETFSIWQFTPPKPTTARAGPH